MNSTDNAVSTGGAPLSNHNATTRHGLRSNRTRRFATVLPRYSGRFRRVDISMDQRRRELERAIVAERGTITRREASLIRQLSVAYGTELFLAAIRRERLSAGDGVPDTQIEMAVADRIQGAIDMQSKCEAELFPPPKDDPWGLLRRTAAPAADEAISRDMFPQPDDPPNHATETPPAASSATQGEEA